MFRSPSLFEDMVKTITGCNVTWRNTIRMNQLLVDRVGKGAFPSPELLAPLTPSKLKARCKVGYRAARIVRLARAFCDGEIDPVWYESTDRTTEELREALLRLEGFGPYAAANMLQLLGHYDHVPIDTETYRHFCHVTGVTRPKNDKELDPLILARYERYAPFQFIAYWFELWRDYERRYGDAWTWEAETTGSNFTAAVLKQASV
ncbi:MAG: endonuclease III domain-containing protein [Planctomycetota bacterium]